MDLIVEGIVRAFQLIIQGDPEVIKITLLSLVVSLSATAISLIIGICAGTAIGLNRFSGRQLLVSLINTGMGAPPVVVGLIVSVFLWRSGPFGFLHLMYTPYAIVIAQCVISLPIITGFTMASIQQIDPKLRIQLVALGASRWQLLWLLVKDTRLPLLAAVMAGFGSIISEVGAAMMVGGNIAGETRVLTTAIVLENSKGEFGIAIALGIILMALVYLVNLALTVIQQRSKPR
ncbi:MAG: tungstate transporter permease [Chloroflexi bacterium RBG_16_48_7]|nr:MAG: tungstate transporter permease [Chloroflexi bacterium RBG_16_48_7]